MKAKYQFSAVSFVAVILLFGALAGSAQTFDFLYSGSETNITLNPGTYDITAYGAQGGAGGEGGGLGAELEGKFNFTTATTLALLVGGSGSIGSYAGVNGGGGGGGGGGSFVVNGTTPLVIAGGGGGGGDAAGSYSSTSPGGNGSTGNAGGAWDPGSGGNGGGGFANDQYIYLSGSGGGGFSGNGGTGGFGGGGGSGGIATGGGGFGGGGGGGSIIGSSAIADLTQVSGVGSPDDSPNGEIIITALLVQPSAPALFISCSGGTVTIYWENVLGWSLQQNGNLALRAGWTASSGVTTSNGTNYLGVVNPTGNLFFRLSF